MTIGNQQIINFSAGPAKIPEDILLKVQKDFLNVNKSGMSVMELSHRSKQFEAILEKAKKDLIQLVKIPSNYSVVFLQGGATTEFASIFYNLVGVKQEELKQQGKEGEEIVVDYLVTGDWSGKASEEAERLVHTVVDNPVRIHRALDVKVLKGDYGTIPSQREWNLTDSKKYHVAYVYYCDNETGHGIEFQDIPDIDPNVPLVTEVSSSFLTRPIDVSKFGIIYGSAQKTLGPTGLTVMIIRNNLLIDLDKGPLRPLMLDFKTAVDNDSMYNTPPTFAIYIVGLSLEWMIKQGGLEYIGKRNKVKSSKLYKAIDESKLFHCPVQTSCRSRVNVIFHTKTKELDAAFLKEAEKRNMYQLQGSRPIGGMRASIYNAISEEDVDALIQLIKDFDEIHN